jgi:hypothetical protein
MSEDVSTALFERIRERCRQLRWYGPDDENSNWVEERYDPASDPGSRLRARLDARAPQQLRFAYPPATEDQLLATEQALGFPLPPLLRALYAEVANGGFGFGFGLRGAIGGFDGRGSSTIVEQYLSRSYSEEILPWAAEKVRLIDLVDYDEQWEEVIGSCRDKVVSTFRHLILPYHLWPEHFLPICNWVCAIESCLDCIMGGVYRVVVTKEEDHLILLQAASLQEMLERWLQLPSDSPELLRGY